MEQEKINELIRRYYDGLTTEDEEATLREYFSKSGIPDDLSTDKAVITMPVERKPEPSAEFLDRVGAIASEKVDSRKNLRIYRYALSAAAGLALLAGSYILFTDKRTRAIEDTFSDPELAMAEVKNILCAVSQNMKTGTEPLSSIKTIGIAGKALNDFGRMSTADKNLDKLRYLNKLDNTSQQKENNK